MPGKEPSYASCNCYASGSASFHGLKKSGHETSLAALILLSRVMMKQSLKNNLQGIHLNTPKKPTVGSE